MYKLKTFVIICILTLYSISSEGQDYLTWEEPVCFTDSLVNNRNVIYGEMDFTYKHGDYFFWEQYNDDSTTWIYYKNFYQEEDQDTLFYDEGVHYHNVNLIISNSYSGSEPFVILYESDKYDNNSIYYRIFNFEEQEFSSEQKLTDSESEQHSLVSNNFGSVTWIENNKVYYTEFDMSTLVFEDPIVLDSGECRYPYVTRFDFYSFYYYQPKLCWVKEINGESNIFVTEIDNMNSWSDPEIIYTSDSITNFSTSYSNDEEFTLSWDNYTGYEWQVIIYDENYVGIDIVIDDGDEPFSPSYFSGWWTSDLDLWSGYLTMIQYESPFISNVYTNPVYYGSLNSFSNVSGSTSQVRNPQVRQIGFESPYYTHYNIWEESINGKWQIMTSKNYAYISEINEGYRPESTLYPNPATDFVRLRLPENKSELRNLFVYNFNGEQIKNLTFKIETSDYNDLTIDCSNIEPGTYMVKIVYWNTVLTKKLIVL